VFKSLVEVVLEHIVTLQLVLDRDLEVQLVLVVELLHAVNQHLDIALLEGLTSEQGLLLLLLLDVQVVDAAFSQEADPFLDSSSSRVKNLVEILLNIIVSDERILWLNVEEIAISHALAGFVSVLPNGNESGETALIVEVLVDLILLQRLSFLVLAVSDTVPDDVAPGKHGN